MAKDPAFLFYPSDFLTGTSFFTDEQVGKYIRLLCHIHQHGHLSEKQVKMICGGYDEDIFNKLKQDENGLFYQERLQNEVDKRKAHSEKQRENIMKRWNKENTKNIPPYKNGITTVIPLLNENENINKDIDVIKEVSIITNKTKNKKNSLVKRTELAKALTDEEFVLEMAKKGLRPCMNYDSPLVLLSLDHWNKLKSRFPVEGLLVEMIKVYNNWKLKKGGVKSNVNDFAGIQEGWVVENAMKILNAKNSFTYDKMRKQQLMSEEFKQSNQSGSTQFFNPSPPQQLTNEQQ